MNVLPPWPVLDFSAPRVRKGCAPSARELVQAARTPGQEPLLIMCGPVLGTLFSHEGIEAQKRYLVHDRSYKAVESPYSKVAPFSSSPAAQSLGPAARSASASRARALPVTRQLQWRTVGSRGGHLLFELLLFVPGLSCSCHLTCFSGEMQVCL